MCQLRVQFGVRVGLGTTWARAWRTGLKLVRLGSFKKTVRDRVIVWKTSVVWGVRRCTVTHIHGYDCMCDVGCLYLAIFTKRGVACFGFSFVCGSDFKSAPMYDLHTLHNNEPGRLTSFVPNPQYANDTAGLETLWPSLARCLQVPCRSSKFCVSFTFFSLIQ